MTSEPTSSIPLHHLGAMGCRIMGQHGEEEGVSLNSHQEEKGGGCVRPSPSSLRHHSSSGEPAGTIDNSMSGPAASFYKHHFTALALCTRETPSLLYLQQPLRLFPRPTLTFPSWAEPKSPTTQLNHLQVHVYPQRGRCFSG